MTTDYFLGALNAEGVAEGIREYLGDAFRPEAPQKSLGRHSAYLREYAREMAWLLAEEEDIRAMNRWARIAHTGLDPAAPMGKPEVRGVVATLLRSVRTLRKDARRLRALALAVEEPNMAATAIGFHLSRAGAEARATGEAIARKALAQ